MLAILTALLLTQATGTSSNGASTNFDAIARRAAAARDAAHLDEALSLYEQALKLRPQWDEGLWNAGSIAYDADRFEECAPLFRRLTAVKPNLAAGWIMSGLCEYGRRNYDEARKSLLISEQLKFDGPAELSRAARLHLAIVLTKAGVYEKAIVLLTELTRMDHKTQDITVAAGIAGVRKPWAPSEVPEGDRERVFLLGDAMSTAMELDAKGAIPKFEAALAKFPGDPDIHFRFGAFLLLQSPERGMAELKKTLECDPGHIPALVGLASVYQKNGDSALALEYGRKAIQAGPNEFAAHIVYGRTLLETDDTAAAAAELEAAVKLAPESADAHYSLATAYSRLGRKEDALREQEEFKRLRKLIDASR
jgi:tetratricopeptide (TPR) repeat protein